jgi:hypothetical protein
MARLLVLDENMWPRLATVELIGRGRAAIALKHTELLGAEDPEVITTVGGWTDVVLVTNDDNMPSEHGDLLARSGLTLAVLAPRTDRAFSLQAWERETVHRWVHLIATQSDGSVVRYTPFGHSMWRPRRRSTVAATGAVKPAIPKQSRIEKSLRQKPEEHEFPLES